MLFKKHKLYLSGGIGNQILHLLIQIDDVIKKKIEPSDLEIIICKYKNSLKEKQYHNIEEIKDYLVFNSKIKITSIFPNNPLKKVKFNPENANKNPQSGIKPHILALAIVVISKLKFSLPVSKYC